MQFRILGPLEVHSDHGDAVTLGGRKPRAVLAVLLLNANEPVSAERLGGGRWGGGGDVWGGGGARRCRAHGARARLPSAQGARRRRDRDDDAGRLSAEC